MTVARSTTLYKRCPKCQAMLRAVAEFCPHCGLHMPSGFPHKPLAPKDMSNGARELQEQAPHGPQPGRTAARYLVLVACDRGDLYAYFRQKFGAESGIDVRYERRIGERRRRAPVRVLDRRREDRRRRPPLDGELRRFGFALVRLE